MIVGGPLTLALLVGFMQSVPFSEMATGGGNLGLWQRGLLLEVQVWFVALGWSAWRQDFLFGSHADRPEQALGDGSA